MKEECERLCSHKVGGVCVCVCVCDVAVRRISLTVGAVEKREVLQILSMCL